MDWELRTSWFTLNDEKNKKYNKKLEEWNKESFGLVRRNLQKARSYLSTLIKTDPKYLRIEDHKMERIKVQN